MRMAKKEKDEAMEGHHHEGCCCCGYGGGRGRFWKGVLVGLLAAWAYSRFCCHHACYGYGGMNYCPAPMGQMAPPPAPKEAPKK